MRKTEASPPSPDIAPAHPVEHALLVLRQLSGAADALERLRPADLEQVIYRHDEGVIAALRDFQYRMDLLIDRQQHHRRAGRPNYTYAEF